MTTISGGVLSTGTTGILANGGTASSIGLSTNAAANLVLDGGTLQYANTSAAESTDRLFTLTSNGGTLDASGSGAVTFAGNGSGAANAIANTGTSARTLTLTGTNTGTNTLAPILADNTGATSLTKSGAGLWQLTGANTYTGPTTVTAGVLKAGVASVAGTSGAFGKNSAVSLGNNSGAALDITGFNTQIGSLTGGGTTGGNVTLGAATLTTGADGTTTSYAGAISGTGGLTKTGIGTQTLSGTSGYTGATTINAGQLTVTGSISSSTGGVAVNGGAALGGTGTVSGAVTVAGGTTAPAQGTINLVDGATGTLTLGSTLALGSGGNTSNFSLEYNGSAFDKVAAAGALTRTGTTVVSLTALGAAPANNTYNILTYSSETGAAAFTFSGGGTVQTIGSQTFTLTNTPTAEQIVVANSTTATTYTLSASAAGGSLANGRLTSGQSTTLTGTITNTGSGTADTLNYTGLAVTPAGAVTPSSGTAIAQGASGTGTASYKFVAPGSITLTPSVATATNGTIGGAATPAGTTTGSVLVDAIAEHVNTATDTGFANTTSTAAYRQKTVYGGNDLGTATVVKGANGYEPAFVNGINGGAGVKTGTLTVQLTPPSSQFAPDASVFALALSGVPTSANAAPAGLVALEADLAAEGVTYVDRFGNTDQAGLTNSTLTFLTATDAAGLAAGSSFGLELVFTPGASTNVSYFDFSVANGNYQGSGAVGNVTNIAVVPEPTSLGLLGLGALGLVGRRRRNASGKA